LAQDGPQERADLLVQASVCHDCGWYRARQSS
jgi:hypothetical protein